MLTKTVDGVVHNYYYAGGKLLRETYGGNTLDFFYDYNGNPFELIYNGTPYFYVLNLQGDVIRLVDSTGTTAATYSYNAWGKLISSNNSTLAQVNPLRYRGYYFDLDTGLYYCQSRYYDPAIGRFINADSYASTGQGFLGYNMFAYCNNNPVMYSDPTGKLLIEALVFIGGSAIIGGLAGAFCAVCTGGNVVEGALEGAALGAVAATATVVTPIFLPAKMSTTLKAAVTFATASAVGTGVDVLTQEISHAIGDSSEENYRVDWGRAIKTGLTTGIAGVVPTYGQPAESVSNAIGSLIQGFDASFINAAIEIAIANWFQ